MTRTIFTDAHPDYDWGCTQTVRITNYATRRGPVREVAINDKQADMQIARYRSGLCWAVEDMSLILQFGDAQEVKP
jgi:hypothetical protein